METALFKECYHYLLAHQYGKGCEAFLTAYQEHPRELSYLYGLLIALLLKSGLNACLEHLAAEKDISPHSALLTRLWRFLKNKPELPTAGAAAVLYNLGLFIMRHVHYRDAKLFFDTCLLLEPGHPQALAASGEIAIREQEFGRGLHFYVQAARQAARQPDRPAGQD